MGTESGTCDADTAIQQRFASGQTGTQPLSAVGAPAIPETSTAPSSDDFFSEHVKRNLPLVIRGGAKDWRATKWSDDTLAPFHDEIVTVAPLQVSGPHAWRDKWLEAASLWEHAGKEPSPATVDERQLLVVSATRVRMRLRKFLRLLRAEGTHATFYADGAGNLEHSFPYLREGYFAPPGFASRLELKRADLWLGGRSVSRMHYDNLDNVFAQVVGSKTFVLARPADGAAVQGGRRLRKARQCYTHPGEFSRDGGGVLKETVLNYLGCDRPATLPTVSVTLGPGDILYLPFGWWHEVHSHPDQARGGMCASVAHFYEPFFCRLGGKTCTALGELLVNPRYDDESEEEESEEEESDGDAANPRGKTRKGREEKEEGRMKAEPSAACGQPEGRRFPLVAATGLGTALLALGVTALLAVAADAALRSRRVRLSPWPAPFARLMGVCASV